MVLEIDCFCFIFDGFFKLYIGSTNNVDKAKQISQRNEEQEHFLENGNLDCQTNSNIDCQTNSKIDDN